MSSPRRENTAAGTPWAAVLLLFAAGCSVALHIGKVPSALPSLRVEWQLTLTETGLIVSLYALLIAASGLMLGITVRRIGYIRFAIAGVAIVGVSSVAGALAESLPVLLITRTLEGLGWVVTVVAFPSLLTALSHPRDHALVMGIWAAFVPLGAGVMLLLAPHLQSLGGWRLSWLIAGIVSLSAALCIFLLTRRFSGEFSQLQGQPGRVDYQDLRKPVVWLLSASFLSYSIMFTSVTSFLPSFMIETNGWTLDLASRFTAFVIMSNALGTVFAGALLRRSVNFRKLLVAGSAIMGVSAAILFSTDSHLMLRIGSAFAFSVGSGLIPGTLFATLPRAASAPAAVGLLVGLMMQCSGVGQLLGGVGLAGVVEYFGSWLAAGVLALVAASAGIVAALLTRFSAWKS